MRECAHTDLICPSLVGGLDLMPLAMFFLRLSWQPSPWWGRDGGARAGASCAVGPPLCLVSVTALSGQGLIPVAGVEDLRVGCKLVLFLFFFFFKTYLFIFGCAGSSLLSAGFL